MLVEIKNLVRHFKSTRAVNNISFGFDAGQIFGFVGPNGAGKTTTMRILATLDQPQYGDCIVDGYSVVEYPDEARKRVGFMPDSLPALRDVTVREYIDFFARAYGLKEPLRSQIIGQVMSFTDLTMIADKTLNALSKGMKQRVSLARALIHDPKVLILDEPANGLDPRARIQMRDLLKALAQSGKAILISSHILSELDEICDGVVFIEKGELLDAGTIDDIVQRQQTRCEIEIRLWTPTAPLTSEQAAATAATTAATTSATTSAAAPTAIESEQADAPIDAQMVDSDQDSFCVANRETADSALKRLAQRLLEWPGVERVERLSDHVVAELSSGDSGAVQLLKQLVEDGFPIVDFHLSQNQLENLFMSITQGNVQ